MTETAYLLSLSLYIYIYIYIESDSMIEIFGKLDKSKIQLKFRCVVFRAALFHIELLQSDTVF